MSPTNLGALRGAAGYNATGAAQDDAAIAAFVTEASAPTTTGAALRSKFVQQLPPPSGNATTDTARITAAINALPTGPFTYGGTVRFQEGQYQVNAPLPLKMGVAFVGKGKVATDLRVVAGNMFEPTISVPHLLFEGLTLTSVAGHIFEHGTGTGGVVQSAFLNMAMVVWTPTSSMVHQNGSGDYLEVWYSNCEFNRKADSLVPAFDVKGPAGGINSNTWENCRPHSNGATSTPFWRLEGTVGSSVHDNRWKNIVGEQNYGGLIHLYNPFGGVIEDVYDWDAAANYVDHIVKLDRSVTPGTEQPRNVHIRNVGLRYGTMAANKYHFYIPAGVLPEGIVIENVGDRTGASLVNVPSTGRVFIGPSGATPSLRTVTADYTVNPKTDGVIVANGATVNVYLPNVTTVPVGYQVRVINKNAAQCGVFGFATSGNTINGAGFVLQAQWVSKLYTSTGTEWIG